MSPRLPSIIQSDIEKKDGELKEIGNRLSAAKWRYDRLEEQIATYGRADAPIQKMRHFQDTREEIARLEITKTALEAERSSLENELEGALLAYQERYQLESGEKFKPTIITAQC